MYIIVSALFFDLGEKQTVMAKTKKSRFDQGIKTKKEVTDTKFVVVLLEELLQFVEEKKKPRNS